MRRTRVVQARNHQADGVGARIRRAGTTSSADPAAPAALRQSLAAIARTAARLCEARDALIFQVDGDSLVLVAKHGRIPTTRRMGETFPLGRDTVYGRAIVERRTVHVRDLVLAARSAFPTLRTRQSATGVRTVLATPLLRDGRAIGVIDIRRTRVQPFTAKQIALLRTFAEQAAIAIDHARVSAELAARNAELEARNRELSEALEQQTATAEILAAISRSPTDVQPVLDTLVASATRFCGADDASIFRRDGDVLRFVAHHGPLPPTIGQKVPIVTGTVGGRSVLERRAVHVADAQAEPEEFPEASRISRELGHRSILSAPLLRDDHALGVIQLRRREVRPFTDRQVALLETFAAQAVIAIENVRLFTELEASNQELQARYRELSEALEQQTATSEILRVISQSAMDAQPVFQAIVESAVRLSGALFGSVLRFDGERIHMVATHNYPAGALSVNRRLFPGPPDRQSFAGRAILDRAVVHVPDVSLDKSRALGRELVEAGCRSAVSVPILRDGEPIGAITVWRAEVGPFSDNHLALLKTFAAQAVIAIENVRLFTELEARNRALSEALERQTATAEILRVISSSPTDIQPVLDVVVRSAARLCESRDVIILLKEGGNLRLGAHVGPLSTTLAAGDVYPLNRRWVSGRAVLDRAPVHVRDIAAAGDEFPEAKAFAMRAGHRAMLAVPLLREDEAVGAILLRRGEVHPFSDQHVELLQTFAAQAVIAIENVRLFTELEARNRALSEALEQQTATGEILRVISSSPTDIQPVLDVVARNSARLCEARDATIVLRDGDVLRRGASVGPLPSPGLVTRAITRGWVTGRAVLDRVPIHVHDLAAAGDEFPEGQAIARAAGHHTTVAVPLLREGEAIGAILVRRGEVRPFADAHIVLLQTFADQAVIAIENVRLFTELEARNRELSEALEQQTATAEILQVIASSPTDLQPVMDAVAQSAGRVCGAEDAVIFRIEGPQVRRVAHFGPMATGLSSEAMAISRDTPFGRAILERRTIHIDDIAALLETEYPGVKSSFAVTGGGTRLVAPMMREGAPIGAILIRRPVVQLFTGKQISLLETFAAQAVIAIENVRLFRELEARTAELTRSVQQLTALGEVGQAVGSTLDLETVLATIASRAAQLTGADACAVSEYDEETETFHQRATHNVPEEIAAKTRARPVRKGEGAMGRLPLTHAPEQIPDIGVPGAYHGPLREPMLRAGMRALLVVPLLRETRLVGALGIQRRTAGEFRPETVELLRTFATQSAIAIQNARLFREIEAKGRQLEVASQHKSQFLANMSHELRTPLNAIIGYTELIGDGIYGEVPARMREVLERVDGSGRHLLGLINDILDLSKIEAGQLRLVLGDYAMADVVQSVAASAEALAAAKSLELAVGVAPDLPAGWGDGRRLTQVLLNLVGNAIKFTDAGRVNVRAEATGEAFVVAVTDTGPGIAASEQERIFEEFQQAETTIRRAKGGTGLGLAISRRIVEMHGGRLWVESTLGQGSTFKFTVPVRADVRAATAAEPTA